ncbi:MAG: hypothetical protein HY782_17305 [Chloroflexi bacterium]|nr:hypothetical protein [Chloroflexota bacterium]
MTHARQRVFSTILIAVFLVACGAASEPAPTIPAPTTAPVSTVGAPQQAPTQAAPAAPVIVSAAGEIREYVEEYKGLLGGPENGGTPGSQPAGYRIITWDTVPDELAAPNNLPSDFFNAATAPRARGAVLSTPGGGVQVSAQPGNASGILPRFGHLNAQYAEIFKTYSPERLFSPVGSNIAELTFFVPGSQTRAVSRGFGAVYTDIDTEHTAFEYFDAAGNSLGKFQAPVANNGLSFLGVIFPNPIVYRVRIAYGTTPLGRFDGGDVDVAVMDDFIYGEPQAIQ